MNATTNTNQSTQSDNSTFKGVTVNDARAQKQQPKPEEKPKEKTPEQKEEWAKVKNRVHDRMFPNAKKDDGKEKENSPAKDAKAAKEGDKEGAAEKDVKANLAKAEELKSKAEKNGASRQQRPTEDKSTDGGDGKQGETEKAEKVETGTATTAKKEATQPPVDYEKLSTSVATATVKAINDSKKESEKKEDDEVPEARRRDVAAIEHLEKTNPKYKGKLEVYKKFARDEADYVAKWEKENAGQKFDAGDDQHSDWYDKHEPDLDPEDITEARVELRAKAIVDRESGSTRSELEKIKLERDIERSERAVPSYIGRNIAMVASAMGEPVAQALSQLKGNENLEDSDPAAHATLATILPELNNQTVAAARIFGTNGRAYDGKNPAHVAVRDAATELEALILEQPAEKLKNERGQTFVTMDKWLGMADAERAQHWSVDADLTSAHLATKASEKAEQNYKTEREKVEKLAKAYGFVKNGEAHTAQTMEVEKETEQEERTAKVHSPSTSGRSIIQPGARTTPKTSADGGDRMLNRMFRRP